MLSYDVGRIAETFYGLFSVSTTITLGGDESDYKISHKVSCSRFTTGSRMNINLRNRQWDTSVSFLTH